jgi:hypothetical protein
MLEELERRDYSPATIRTYLGAVQQFAEHFHCSPEQLGPEHLRRYQLYLLRDRKLAPSTVEVRISAMRIGRPFIPCLFEDDFLSVPGPWSPALASTTTESAYPPNQWSRALAFFGSLDLDGAPHTLGSLLFLRCAPGSMVRST